MRIKVVRFTQIVIVAAALLVFSLYRQCISGDTTWNSYSYGVFELDIIKAGYELGFRGHFFPPAAQALAGLDVAKAAATLKEISFYQNRQSLYPGSEQLGDGELAEVSLYLSYVAFIFTLPKDSLSPDDVQYARQHILLLTRDYFSADAKSASSNRILSMAYTIVPLKYRNPSLLFGY